MTTKFLRHEACDKCGSSNNVAVWWNEELQAETHHCFTCDNHKYTKDVLMEKSAIEIYADPLTPTDLAQTAFSQDIATRYDIRKNGSKWYFPYKTPTGVIVDAKVRDYSIPKNEDFHFTWIAKGVDRRPLYGMHTCSRNKALIITTGEKDAPAACQMMGWNSVSVPNGDDAAIKAIKNWFDWIDQFDFIYLCFDNDESGVKAAAECADFIGFKAKIVSLPRYTLLGEVTKDPYDYLKHHLHEQFKQAVWSASTQTPKFVLSHSDFVSRAQSFLFDKERRTGFSSGIPALDEIIGGFRAGEISTLLGAPGRGKSSVGRHTLATMATQNVKTLYISLEEQPEVAEIRLLELITGRSIITDETITPNEFVHLAEAVKDKVIMADLGGTLDLAMLEKVIYYAVKMQDVKFVLFDHITAAVGADELVWKAIATMMDKMNQLAQQNNIHICIVSHITRKDNSNGKAKPKNTTTLLSQDEDDDDTGEAQDDPIPSITDGAYGSSIERYTHLQIGVRRIDSRGLVKLHVLKNRLLGTLGVVTTVFDKGRYEATKIYVQGRNGKGGESRLIARGSAGSPLPRAGSSTQRTEIRGVPETVSPGNECSVPGKHEGEPTPIPPTLAHTGLPTAQRVDSGNERGDDSRISYEDRVTQAAASERLQEVPHMLSRLIPPHPRTKMQLRQVGDRTRLVVGGCGEEGDDTGELVCTPSRASGTPLKSADLAANFLSQLGLT